MSLSFGDAAHHIFASAGITSSVTFSPMYGHYVNTLQAVKSWSGYRSIIKGGDCQTHLGDGGGIKLM